MRLAVRRLAAPAGEVLVDPDLTTAALVLAPSALDVGPLEQLRQLPDSPRNVALYERHGYVALRELRLPRGPVVWTMLAQ